MAREHGSTKPSSDSDSIAIGMALGRLELKVCQSDRKHDKTHHLIGQMIPILSGLSAQVAKRRDPFAQLHKIFEMATQAGKIGLFLWRTWPLILAALVATWKFLLPFLQWVWAQLLWWAGWLAGLPNTL